MKLKTILLVGIGLISSIVCAQNFNPEHSTLLANRRMIEIKKLVSLSAEQENKLLTKCIDYQLQLDSALYFERDPLIYVDMINIAEKQYTQFFYETLNNQQTMQYVNAKGNADVRRKTEDRMAMLRETEDYKESELLEIEEQVFNYLMLEKVVYMRDKHNVAKQKENIHRLKSIQPTYIKAAESHRKLKHDGRIQNGRVKWNK